MRILLITDSYPPEIRSASRLMYELAEELTARGHGVTVLTAFLRYNLTVDLEGRIRDYPLVSEEKGIRVVRIKTLPIHNVNHVVRGIGQLALPFLFLWGGANSRPSGYFRGILTATSIRPCGLFYRKDKGISIYS